jgi:hypothetical protein
VHNAVSANTNRDPPGLHAISDTTTNGLHNTVSSSYTIEPLNPLPDGVTWLQAIAFDPIADVLSDLSPAHYGQAMHFQDEFNFCVPILQPFPI